MTEKPKTRAELLDEVQSYLDALTNSREECSEQRRTIQRLEADVKTQRSALDGLLDDLHRLTIENARLEGYRDRVLEFDPVTERQQYQDETNAQPSYREHFGTPPHTIRQRPVATSRFGGGGVMAAERAYGESLREPWYRRRA